IDLIDEAASRLKMEIDSVPTPIDDLQRKLVSLEIERQALGKEEDRASRDRLVAVDAEIADLQEKIRAMRAQWQRETDVIGRLRGVKEKIESTKTEADLAQRRGDLNKAAELRYGALPSLEKTLAEVQREIEKMKAEGGGFLREEVTEEDVARVVARWTGIPV